jgi:lipid-A-disaccharide synthase
MPGSRHQEIEELCEPMLGAARIILTKHPEFQAILPLAAPHLESVIREKILRSNISGSVVVVREGVYELLSMCRLLILASGTATLEGALLGVPMVAAYRVSPVTYMIGRGVVKSRYIAMPNILLDEEVIPEVLQTRVTAEVLASLGLEILLNPHRAQAIVKKFQQIRDMLGTPGVVSRVARSLLHEAASIRTHDTIAKVAVLADIP